MQATPPTCPDEGLESGDIESNDESDDTESYYETGYWSDSDSDRPVVNVAASNADSDSDDGGVSKHSWLYSYGSPPAVRSTLEAFGCYFRTI